MPTICLESVVSGILDKKVWALCSQWCCSPATVVEDKMFKLMVPKNKSKHFYLRILKKELFQKITK